MILHPQMPLPQNVITATNGISSLGYFNSETLWRQRWYNINCNRPNQFNGSVRIGDSASDGVEFVADIISGLRPNADSSFDIGATNFRWRQLFVDDAIVTSGANIGALFRIESTQDADSVSDYTTSFRTDGGAIVTKKLYVGTALDVGSTITGGSSLAINGSITGATTITASGEIEGGSLDINGAGDVSGQLNVGSLVILYGAIPAPV